MNVFFLMLFLSLNLNPVQAQDSTISTDSDTNYIPAKSGYQTQKENTQKVLKKTGKIIMETASELGKQILGDSSSQKDNPDYLYQQIRLEYTKLTKDIPVPTIKASALLSKFQDSNYVLIDVRQDIEQRVSMIPGAITPNMLAKNYRTPASIKGKTFITYCTIGYRSGLYAEKLKNKKLNVLNLEGGILAWSHEKGPLIHLVTKDSSESTKNVHVYDKSWNFLHPDYTPKW